MSLIGKTAKEGRALQLIKGPGNTILNGEGVEQFDLDTKVERASFTRDLTGRNNFTGGEIVMERVGNIVVIHSLTTLTFASGSDIRSDTGTIPSHYIPMSNAANTFIFSSTYIGRVLVQPNGQFRLLLLDWNGSAANQSSTSQLTISYLAG